ncbi:hypothetical protein [Psychrobacter sp. R86515]|uniref:hypothetical protein n=1 Tax=Psychrobacter sp. R86515 TaxID=3093855 RepID=UPI0036D29F6B
MDNDNTSLNPKMPTSAIFTEGDIVLCPAVGNDAYTLIYDHDNGSLGFVFDNSVYHYGNDGKADGCYRSITDLFHNTLANRQAIATLYPCASTTTSCQRNVIDLTLAGDDEVIYIPSLMLSDIACDISGVCLNLDSIGHLFYLIYQNKINAAQANAMTRLAHDSVNTWKKILCSQLDDLNQTLSYSAFGTVEIAL